MSVLAMRDYSQPIKLELVDYGLVSGSLNLEFVEEPEKVTQLPLMHRHFSGHGVKTMATHERLEKQHVRIKRAMADGVWRTVSEIHKITGFLETSISAQLRNLRKYGFGSHEVQGNERSQGLWEFRLIINWERETDLKKPSWGSHLREASREDHV